MPNWKKVVLSGSSAEFSTLNVDGAITASGFSGDGSGLTGITLTETDPIFSAHTASSITSGQIGNWNTAYGWGDHSLGGYLTSYTETDPTVPSHVKSITTGNISNWNTAYGWGDHDGLYVPVGGGSITGDLTVGGTITAQEFHSELVSSSIVYESGSTKFGDSADDTHSFTGSLAVLGNISANNLAISNWNTAYGWGDHSQEGYITGYTETDPIFLAHTASSITDTHIINWNIAHSWGDHSTEGYLKSHPTVTGVPSNIDNSGGTVLQDLSFDANGHVTGVASVNLDSRYLQSFTETDPVFTAHTASSITSTQISNWNTAYGWGDHDGLYLPINGNADSATSASYAVTASYALTGPFAATSHTHAASDVTSGTFATARIPNLSADKITSGTINDARLPDTISSDITGNAATATSALLATSASHAEYADDAGYATSAGSATSASYASTAPYSGLTGTIPTWNQNTTGNAATATSASHAVYADTAGSAGSSTNAVSASHADSTPYSGLYGTVPTWNQNTTGNAATATTASYAETAPYSGLTGTVPTWNQNTTGNAATATTASYAETAPYSGLQGTVPTWNQDTTGNAATADLATTASYAESGPFASSGHTHSVLGSVNFSNGNLTNVNNIVIGDPGPGEGIEWGGGSGFKIYESPNDLTTNSGGNLQFVSGSTRVLTLDTSGNAEFTNNVTVAGNLTVTGTTITNNVETVSTSNGVVFEGSAADDNELILKAGTLTADRTITLPDADGTVALTGHTHAAGDITSGTFAAARIPNLDASKITAGTLDDARLPNSITSDITGNAATATSASHAIYADSAGTAATATSASYASYGPFAATAHNHAAGNITSGTFADARIALSNITQHTDPKYLRSNADDDFTGHLFNGSINETPAYNNGAIRLQPSVSGGSTGITFQSKVNSTSDAGYIWWYDDNDHYNELNSTENGVLLIAAQNDGGSTSEDAIAIESSGDIYLNPGVASGAIGSGTHDSARGNIYLGHAATRWRILTTADEGSGNGLDADTLDGNHATAFATAGHNHDSTYLGISAKAADSDKLDGLNSTQFLRSDASDTMSGVLTITSTADAQLRLQSTDSWTGIGFDDGAAAAVDYIWHNGSTGTFALGGGGSTVSGKKLHVDGGMTVGSSADGVSMPSNGLYVEGNVSIGTTSNSAPLEIYGSGSTVFDVQGSVGQLFSITDDLTGDIFSVADISGIPILNVNASGQVDIDGDLDVTGDITAYSTSDIRLKKNIKPIEEPLEKLKQISGNTFEWDETSTAHNNKGKDVGVIAQEIEKVLPEIVGERRGHKAVQYEKIVALLIESNKALLARVEELEAKIK